MFVELLLYSTLFIIVAYTLVMENARKQWQYDYNIIIPKSWYYDNIFTIHNILRTAVLTSRVASYVVAYRVNLIILYCVHSDRFDAIGTNTKCTNKGRNNNVGNCVVQAKSGCSISTWKTNETPRSGKILQQERVNCIIAVECLSKPMRTIILSKKWFRTKAVGWINYISKYKWCTIVVEPNISIRYV